MKFMLNESQQKAVEDTEGAVLVFAGAGSGKTRVLTHRVIHLIEDKHVPDYNILAITFTNKATGEMRQRLFDMLGENAVWVSTFHSLCVKILYRNAERLGYTSSFSIFDESASKRVMQRVLREKHLEDEKDKDKYKYHISTAKNMGLRPDEYFARIRTQNGRDAMLITEVYERYDEILKENNAMDFDDLLMKCRELLVENEDVLSYYQNKFRYIHVDEFQDTNEIQFEIVRLLAGKWGNLFVVGDDDQSIYGWRGANVKNILEFDKCFPDVKTYKLEQNYRSTQQILDAANRLIKHNKARSDKQLFSDKKDGVKVEYLFCANEYNEVDNVVDRIMSLKRNQGYSNGDFAILVRTNSLTRLFEKSFNSLRMPYRIFGGFRFFDRKEILDVVAYMRLIVNPLDSEALTRIINFPKRGIGDTTIANLEEYAASIGEPLTKVIDEIADVPGISPAAKAKIAVFNELIAELTMAKGQMDLVHFADFLVKKVGFEEYYKAQEKEEEVARWENIDEFLRYVEETTENNPDLDLTDFLQTLALNNEVESDDEEEKITIATMHSAKGLEFKVVFIVACEESIIPSAQSLKDNGVEEERRVMYVAMTRAQERLYISCVKGIRNRFNRQENTMPSRFIAEAKGEMPKTSIPTFSTGRYGNNPYASTIMKRSVDRAYERNDDYSDAIPHEGQMRLGNTYQGNTTIEQPKKVYNKSADGFVSGAKVRHKKYGIGTIIIVTGTGPSTTVTVTFEGLGLKKFALMNAPLELLK